MAMVVANRYARALAEVVARTGDYHKVLQELKDFSAVYGESAELREICETPAVPLLQKIKVLEAILERSQASAVTLNFLRVLLAHYRMGMLEEVIEAFQKVANDRLGIVQVKIFSPTELSEAEREALRMRFAEITRKQVKVEFHLEAGLLGGILAQIGSTLYDGSIRGSLEQIRQELMGR
jgi:F-type H+-transporting ATPase subunit delta